MFSPVLGVVMSFIAALTAFYMFRLYYNIFWGKESEHEHTPHEAPKAMTLPLIFLAVVTLFAGFIPFGKFVSSNGMEYIIHLDWSVAITSIIVAVVSIAIATWFYKNTNPIPDRLASTFSGLHRAAYKRFYMDELYLFITKRIIFNYISRPIAWFDRHVIDGAMNGLAAMSQWASYSIRGLQSGQIQQYAYVILLGSLLILVLVLLTM